MKKLCKIIVLCMAVMVGVSFSLPAQTIESHAASKIKISKKSVITNKGKTVRLKVKGTSKKVRWSSSNKKVATVKKGRVKAKNTGKVTITAKVGKKKLRCKVRVYPNYKSSIVGIWGGHDKGEYSSGEYVEWQFKKNGRFVFMDYYDGINHSVTEGKYKIKGNTIALSTGEAYNIKKVKKNEYLTLKNQFYRYVLYPRHV